MNLEKSSMYFSKKVGAELADAWEDAELFHQKSLYFAMDSVPRKIDPFRAEIMAAFDRSSKSSKGLILLLIPVKGNLDPEMKMCSVSSRIDEDMNNPFLDFLLYMQGQVLEIFHQGLVFLKLVLTVMELSLSVIKELAAEDAALDFLIHLNGMLEDKVSNTSLALSESLEMYKLIKVELFLIELLNYKANLVVPAKERISALNEGLQFLRKFLTANTMNDLLLTWRADLIARVTYRIQAVLREMNFLRSFLLETEIQCSEHPEVNDLTSYATDVAYEAECVIDLFIVTDCPIWCLVLWISDFIYEIGSIKTPAIGIYAKQMYDGGVLNVAKTLGHMKPEAGRIHDVIVGLNDQLEIVINRFTSGSLQLDIVSILGMPGIGKTTLTK